VAAVQSTATHLSPAVLANLFVASQSTQIALVFLAAPQSLRTHLLPATLANLLTASQSEQT